MNLNIHKVLFCPIGNEQTHKAYDKQHLIPLCDKRYNKENKGYNRRPFEKSIENKQQSDMIVWICPLPTNRHIRANPTRNQIHDSTNNTNH